MSPSTLIAIVPNPSSPTQIAIAYMNTDTGITFDREISTVTLFRQRIPDIKLRYPDAVIVSNHDAFTSAITEFPIQYVDAAMVRGGGLHLILIVLFIHVYVTVHPTIHILDQAEFFANVVYAANYIQMFSDIVCFILISFLSAYASFYICDYFFIYIREQ